ncbi:hypothetical protein M0P65_01810 [Candidatus Gracilibacteria bacterium]|nr:hypothetical protein [Candidatus Gracilibacteria bacterium]
MDNLETIIENIDLVIDKLTKQQEKEYNGELFKITFIKNNIFSVEGKRGNINYYVNSEGEITVSPGRAYKLPGYSQKLEKLGYKEEKVGTEYIMTRLSDNSKVDKYSIEYYNIFADLDFDFSLKYLKEAKTSKNRLSRSQALELLPTFINAGSLTIGELESFMERGSITKEDFEKFLPKMRKLLKEQTIDERGNMRKFSKEITEKEIKEYLQKGYIDQNLANECYEIIKKREEKNKKKEEIKLDTISSLELEKRNLG